MAYIVIDEFHAFIGSERGIQLLSLLNRIDHVLGRQLNPVPRIALSATLGELEKCQNYCARIRDYLVKR